MPPPMMLETIVTSPTRHDLRATAAASTNGASNMPSTGPSPRRPISPENERKKTMNKSNTSQALHRRSGSGSGQIPPPHSPGTAHAHARTGRGRVRQRGEGGGRSPRSGSGERNILKVVLGDLLFETWYGSFYPDELVSGGAAGGRASAVGQPAGGGGAAKAAGAGGGDVVVERLYVCRWCFRYSRELMPYMGHVKMCPEKEEGPPGFMIYSHDAYSIYEVDGEESKLFCQNLSLFAKLFLDNKSVCFDLSAFKYYLLVHSSPSLRGSAAPPQQQVVGFFSKEKMSWDNNNLACILVFPPWQRKGLGKILMGVSYELSKREGRIGGPEKPLSDLGKRGYISFWSSTIARHILASPLRKSMTVNDISQGTFIVAEDVVAALKEMNVLNPKKRGPDTAVINKAKVREWAQINRVDLAPAVDPDGFVEELGADAEEEEMELES
ncbi:MAG: hypothetical protein M4579_005078 [Chaenotheca gracillima]|nr:MAG: hypothetical protein M4579_005078 [Chaenotheca gracillima]